jgi:DNA-binding Lrp family transcriptional regulator
MVKEMLYEVSYVPDVVEAWRVTGFYLYDFFVLFVKNQLVALNHIDKNQI